MTWNTKSVLESSEYVDTLGIESAVKNASRLTVIERTNYEPAIPEERFIVPLLRHCIESVIAKYATPPPPDARGLDVGCGRQPFRNLLENLGYSYTGLDVRQNPEETVDLLCAIDEPLPADISSQGPFHFVLCTEVLEHVADWDKAFNNLATLMGKGGRLLITCPHFYRLHEEPYDFWRPTLHALTYFASRAGFRTLHQEAAGEAWDVLGTLLADCRPYSASDRLVARGMTKLVSLSVRAVFNLLCDGGLQRAVKLRSSAYLSNIIVLELS